MMIVQFSLICYYNQYFVDAGGVAIPQIRHELIWERVANVKGLPGNNVGLDLLNEFYNNEFKGIDLLQHLFTVLFVAK